MINTIREVLLCNKCGAVYSVENEFQNGKCGTYACNGRLEKQNVDFPKFDEYGVWEVYTEGDCEGRSVRDLGAYQGKISDIAVFLKDKCYYTLRFERFKGIKVVGDMEEPDKHIRVDVEELGCYYPLRLMDYGVKEEVYNMFLDENKVTR